MYYFLVCSAGSLVSAHSNDVRTDLQLAELLRPLEEGELPLYFEASFRLPDRIHGQAAQNAFEYSAHSG